MPEDEPIPNLLDLLRRSSADEDMKKFFDDSPDRGLGIALPCILENRLTDILRDAMRPDDSISKNLFRQAGALGNFAIKVDVAYMFGLIPKEMHRDLQLIVRIRNDFAHNVEIKTFDDYQISSRIKDMHIYGVMISIRDSHPYDPASEQPAEEKMKAMILRDEMETMRSAFRMCVRMLIDHLNIMQIHLAAQRSQSGPAS